ncbi:rod shape-determining protein MreB [Spiroplasma mirum ATCC 29335]|uniref:Cell shape-determining protein MreB n=1 Tax=Spiroplasma mirum ATCC 29335 TaxID=838561 RepID=W0GR20_9MOLU|nr:MULTISPECIES: rod shape-determining protein [Spiroplasma]AHF61548.1 cell shape determining protein MreB2 [Spiroplasma mirum ATCC 29335]AHI58703.1 rod shape-determining protein MreB [Spiroplasma mirum ATCC 29335]AKM53585.1 cell shape determining protein MreB [Spiroplasma atrichopogonis]
MANYKFGKEYSFLALDLGTANTVAYVAGQGIVYNEPSIMAYDTLSNSLVALGEEAYKMIGKTHDHIKMVTPLVDGVISDMDAAQDLLKHIFGKLKMTGIWKNSLVILACPSGVTELERSALKVIAKDMGASYVLVEEEVKLAALGAGINIGLAQGNLVIDIGGGTTDIAILSAGDIVKSKSVKVAGKHFDQEIQKYIRAEYNVLIGIRTAEQIKKDIGALVKIVNEKPIRAFGRDIITGLPREVMIKPEEIKNVLLAPFSRITDLLVEVLEETPPELAGDVIRNGITICGGGTLIRGIVKYFESIFQLKVRAAQDPLMCVIDGAKTYEKNLDAVIERIELLEAKEYKI